MAIDKENLKKGVFLIIALVTLGIAMPLMMGNQTISYFMVELPNGKQILAQALLRQGTSAGWRHAVYL